MIGARWREGHAEGFADIDGEEAVRLARKRGAEARGGFIHRFGAELERLVMDRCEVACAGLLGHRDGLLGRAVGVNPRVVRADRHQRQIDRLVASRQRGEGVCVRGVAAKENGVCAALQEVAVVSAMGVADGARAPVLDRDGADREGSSSKETLNKSQRVCF